MSSTWAASRAPPRRARRTRAAARRRAGSRRSARAASRRGSGRRATSRPRCARVRDHLQRRAPAAARTSTRRAPCGSSWCVCASTPGVSRTSTRSTPAAAARSGSSGASRTTVAPAAAAARELLVGLVVAVEEDPVAADAGRLRERELAERRDVGADALLGEDAQDRDVRERLRPVDDERARRRVGVRARLGAERLLAVDDERRAVLGRERRRRRRRRSRARRPRRGAEIGKDLVHAC